MTNNSNCLISVVMPVFNEKPDIICYAINSILQQTHVNIELLIFDDSTEAGTLECLLNGLQNVLDLLSLLISV